MASNGLDKWFKQKWVDIGSKRKDGSFAKCGRSKQKADAKRKYPKCLPLAKARRLTESQRRSAVARKRAAANVGPKPTNVATFAKRKKMGLWRISMKKPKMSPTSDKPNPPMNSMMRQAQKNYIGSYISGDLGGVKVSNKSYKKYYGNKVKP